MYANFMAHPDMFLSITSGRTPEERIVRFVEYYLTAFHEGRKGAVAKKPYNPILGENFHCSWYVPRDRVRPHRTANCSAPNPAPTATTTVPGSPQRGRNSDCYRVGFVAEQVSHHPPVSGFYCECKEKRMCVNSHVWTKSKFLGMSVGVSMVGEGVLYLLEHDEEYVFTLPCAYARSILTVPWVELGGKVTIGCAKSGYSATVTFHTKPFYGGKVHSRPSQTDTSFFLDDALQRRPKSFPPVLSGLEVQQSEPSARRNQKPRVSRTDTAKLMDFTSRP
ncbi:Oxysterol-binding protein-related protein 10 [Liparis tanakae]|uniref:Oxysterol-binding protein n=1 Tax=Liparis tanakae TaxID=230148 RepID=A0A4Z2F958_9TELE|nr:Oxysterol-binding protein-related protein 10 [Liparis tanakae]